MIFKVPASIFLLLLACLILGGCNGGGDSASSSATSSEAPSTLDLIGSEIAFNPTIRFTSATDCTYDNTLATENTLPQPTIGLIQATYTAVENEGSITITISSIDESFTNDVVLVLSGWTDLDQDGFIDQFTVKPSMGSILSLSPMTGQFTSNPPPLPGADVSASNLPVFAGGDSNRSPTSAEWNDYVVGKQLVLLYTDGEVSTLSMQSSSAYVTSDAPGNTVQGTYAYERLDDSTGRLTAYESRSYGNPQSPYGNPQQTFTKYITSQRQAVFTLNFYNTDPLSDLIHGKPGGLGIHFERTTDIEKYSAVYLDTDLDGVADSDIKEQASSVYGSLRVYNDASLLIE